MAQATLFIPVGSMQVVKDQVYTSADLPSIPANINAVRIVEAPLIWRKALKQNGDQIIENGEPKYIKGSQRGVRILITDTTTTYVYLNVPALYKEGEEIAIGSDNTYKFLNSCVVEYGVRS